MASRTARFGTYVSNLIPSLQSEGYSGAQALNILRGLGLGIRTQTFYHEWGAQIAEGAVRESIITANIGRLPTGREVTRRISREATGYYYQIRHLVEDPLSGEITTVWGGYSGSTLVTYQEAIQAAEFGYIAAQAFDPRCPQGRLIGTYVSAVRQYVTES